MWSRNKVSCAARGLVHNRTPDQPKLGLTDASRGVEDSAEAQVVAAGLKLEHPKGCDEAERGPTRGPQKGVSA